MLRGQFSRLGAYELINRRQLLERDPPVRWREIIQDLRKKGWGTSELCFVLNVQRGTLWHWENDEYPMPGYEDGRALVKLHAQETAILKINTISRPPTGTFCMQVA
jgi:hypothetical protein